MEMEMGDYYLIGLIQTICNLGVGALLVTESDV